MRNISFKFAAALVPLFFATYVAAQGIGVQKTLFPASGSANPGWGTGLSEVGDLDLDGVTDFAVGAPKILFVVGRVRAISGLTGATIWEASPPAGFQLFGSAIVRLPDQNGDGVPEIGVGAPGTSSGGVLAGAAFVLSGATGAILTTMVGPFPNGRFGETLAAISIAETAQTYLVVGSPGAGGNGGSFTLFNPVNGVGAYVYNHLFPGELCADAIANCGDFDGDGSEDLAVGFPNRPNTNGGVGEVRIWSFGSIPSPNVITISGNASSNRFGAAVAGAGDLDADGLDDLIVGDPDYDTGIDIDAGRVQTLTGPIGQTYTSVIGVTANQHLGTAVAGIGDLDGDGHGDVAYGSPQSVGSTAAPRVTIRSGRTWSTLGTILDTTTASGFGAVVSAAGDIDGDNLVDILVANPTVSHVQLVGPIPRYPGSRDDLAFGIGLDGSPATQYPDQRQVGSVLPITVRVSSPAGTYVGTPPAIAGWLKPTGAPAATPAGFPELHILPSQAVLLFDPFAYPFLGPTLLTSDGFSIGGLTPNGFAGFTLVLQGFVLAPSATTGNPFFTAANAIEIVLS